LRRGRSTKTLSKLWADLKSSAAPLAGFGVFVLLFLIREPVLVAFAGGLVVGFVIWLWQLQPNPQPGTQDPVGELPGIDTGVGIALADAGAALRQLESALARIPESETKERLTSLKESAEDTATQVAAQNELLPRVQRLMIYYLPRTAQLAEFIADHPDSADGLETAQILKRLELAFERFEVEVDEAAEEEIALEIRTLSRSLDEDFGPDPTQGGKD
jgi:nitrate reductase NapE component